MSVIMVASAKGGVGKSTLLKLILGMLTAEKGSVVADAFVPTVRSEENAICTEPIWNSSIERATVRSTNVTDIASLFEREWKNLSKKEKSSPMIAPRTSESTTSRIGSTITERTLTAPS